MCFSQLQQQRSSAQFPNFIGTNYISEISNDVHCASLESSLSSSYPTASVCGIFVHHGIEFLQYCGHITGPRVEILPSPAKLRDISWDRASRG